MPGELVQEPDTEEMGKTAEGKNKESVGKKEVPKDIMSELGVRISAEEIGKALDDKRVSFLKLHMLVREHGTSLVKLRSKSPIEFVNIYNDFTRIFAAGGSKNPKSDFIEWLKLAKLNESVESFFNEATNNSNQLKPGEPLHDSFSNFIAGLTAELAAKKESKEEKKAE
jgi:hypothetical protein